jgi:membrane-bound lytic murein transglycosylase D
MCQPTATTALRGSGLALVVLLTVACSDEKAMPPELAGVYSRIHDSRQDYEAGIELILQGDEIAGQNMLAAATTRLFVATRECSDTPGCDMRLFIDSMEQLADEQRFARRELQTAAETEAENDAATLELDAELSGQRDGVPNSVLTGADLIELIPRNAKVKAAANGWLTWRRSELAEAYENYQFLRPKIAPIYRDAGLPEALLFAMMAQESGGKVHAYSRAGAVGPLQFMRRTALQYGLRTIDGFDTRLDPIRATQANVRYLEDLRRMFDGNLELVLAAYNMGDTRLRRMCRRYNSTDFWDPRLHYALPWETREYVPAVLAAAWLFQRPADFGLRLPARETIATSITLEEDISLGELAICLGPESTAEGWFRTLRNLNPRLSPGERSPAGTSLDIPATLVPTYAGLCVGDERLLALARELHDADYPEQPEVRHYTVRRGDTLAAIAARHRCSLREVAEMNSIRPPSYVIHVGQRLTLPARS